MRHPLLRLFQALCLAALGLVTALARPAPAAPPLPLWVGVLGEAERPDGSWEGADLLAGATARIDRFQVTLRPKAPVRVRLEAVSAGGVEPLFPAHPGDALLRPGRAYALPGPRQFFEIRGEARLRLIVDGAETPLRAYGETFRTRYPLSDGAAAPVTERAFAPGGMLEVPLRGR